MKLLFENFDKIIAAPNGITKARELILQLAIQGKLTEQWRKENPDVEDASELLKKIKTEKEKLIKEGRIKKQKVQEIVKKEERYYTIPKIWIWTRLNTIYDVRDGTHDTPKYVDEGIPLVTSKNISSGGLEFSNVKLISEKDHNSIQKRSKVEKNDILFAMIGSIGNPVIVNTDKEFSIKNVALFKYYNPSLSSPHYLRLFLQEVSKEMKKKSSGAVQPFVSLNFLRNYIFPLPPLEEQKQIVKIVNSMLLFLDELEEKQNRLNEKRIKLNNSSLDKLVKSENTKEFKLNWNRITQNFEILYSVPKNVDKLKQTILQLAVQGKLTEQWRKENPNVEPASELLKKIKEVKEKLIREGKIKKQPEYTLIKKSEQSSLIPTKWEWSRIGNTHYLMTGATPSTSKKEYFGGNIKWLVSGDIHKEEIFNCEGRITELGMRNSNCKLLPKDSVLIALNGQGKTRATVAILRTEATCNQSLVSIVNYNKLILPEYLFWNLRGRYYAIRDITGQKQRRGLNMSLVGSLVISVPPLEEQKQIVNTVNELMTICNRLEEKIKLKTEEQEKLVEAVITKAINFN